MTKWEFLKENYIDKGLKIFPIVPNSKTPMIEKWQEECSSDYFQILYWYEQCPECNWALPCSQNDIFVLDLDRHDPNKDGVENFAKLVDKLLTDDELDYFATCEQVTPSGGNHIIFKTDEELKNVSNAANVFKDYQGIDIRTDGYILVAPSEINGKKYGYATINNCDPQPMPRKIKKYILENASLKSDSNKEPYKKPTSVEVGDRDNQLFLYINDIYYKTRLDFDEILCLAFNFNETILEKPFPDRVVRYKVKKAFEKPRDKMIFVNLGE